MVIISYSLPDEAGQCKNSNYVEVQTTETLNLALSIDESEMGPVKLGSEVEITVNAIEDKKYTGIITSIDETGTYASKGSSFSATVTLINDGNIKLGMSASCTVSLEKAEDVVVALIEAIKSNSEGKYVTVVNSDGTTKDVDVELRNM